MVHVFAEKLFTTHMRGDDEVVLRYELFKLVFSHHFMHNQRRTSYDQSSTQSKLRILVLTFAMQE